MQIKLNKPLSDLSNLLMRNNLQPTPKRSTLINQYPKAHKENQININNMNRSPARSNSRKALGSKDESMQIHQMNGNESRNRAKSRRVESEQLLRCQNHEDILGDFHINIEGQDLYYCEKCAFKLKHQGFPTRKINEQTHSQEHHRRQQDSKHQILPAYSHFEGHPQFEMLKKLLAHIYQSQQKIINIDTSKTIDEFFNRLSMDLDCFYDRVQELVRIKRQESKSQLISLNQSLIHKSKSSQLSSAIHQIKMMKKDIEENVESIIGEVEEQTFIECVESYQDSLNSLNSIAEQRLVQIQRIKHKYQKLLEHQANQLQLEIQKISILSVSCSSQKVICSEGEQLYADEGTRGPFRNLFHNQKDRPRKRLISRK